MNQTPAHHTAAENWAARPRRTEGFTVKKVEDHGDSVTLLSTDGMGFMLSKADLGRQIQAGERLQLETVQASHITGLRDVNGWLFRLTNQQLADEAREFSESLHRRRVEELERSRQKWAAQEAALPEWLQARIRRFRERGGEEFLRSGWGYELFICLLADLIDRGEEPAAHKLACDDGASGNQWDCAKALANGRKHHGDQFGALLPAGLSPLTGSADYS